MGYISDIRRKVGHDAVFMPAAACGTYETIRSNLTVSSLLCNSIIEEKSSCRHTVFR